MCLSVYLLVTTVSPTKTDEVIEMLFVLWNLVGLKNYKLAGGQISPEEGVTLGAFWPIEKHCSSEVWSKCLWACVCVGKCWMDALELALRCSSLLMRTMTRDTRDPGDMLTLSMLADEPSDGADDKAHLMSLRQQMNDSDCERHFNGQCTSSVLVPIQ